MNSIILDIPSVETAFVFEELLKLALNVICDWLPTAVIVHCITETLIKEKSFVSANDETKTVQD